MSLLVVIRKNGEEFRTFRGFHAPDGDVVLHVLRAAVANHPELKEPLMQQERRRLNLGHTRGVVYTIEWGPATTIRTPRGHRCVGWADGTWHQKV